MMRAAGLMIMIAAAQPTIPVSDVYGGDPPIRYMGNRALTVSFGTLSQCGTPPEGKRFAGCMRGPLVHMPNPCDFRKEGEFAQTMCHELGHANGWPRTHGD